ncbi:MAG: hypothetical protein NTX53_09840 [candidate division WOR-3 bacterium]|nr:hypothetical protein [candidate division WOR-3 bacterium]
MKRASLIGAVLVGLIALGGLSVAFGWCGWTSGHGWTRPAGYVRPATTGYGGSYWCGPMMNYPAGYYPNNTVAPQPAPLGPTRASHRVRSERRTAYVTQNAQPRVAYGGCCGCW